MIHFPMWIIVPRGSQASAGQVPVAFSSLQKMAAYLRGNRRDHGYVRLVARYFANGVLTELFNQGHYRVAYDVNNDGSGGRTVGVPDIMASI
jgi:hypothetical protein